MKKILLTLLLSAFLLSGCGAEDSGNSLSVETNQPSGGTSNSEQAEDTKQTEDTKQAEKEDVSGIYTDKQGTADVYSQMTLALQADGTYAVEISIYRTTELEGTAVWEGDTLRFTGEDPYVLADISVTGSKAEVMVITDAAGVLAGDVYSFPDGTPGENPEQTEEDSSQQSLSEKIAMEIFCAEERAKKNAPAEQSVSASFLFGLFNSPGTRLRRASAQALLPDRYRPAHSFHRSFQS